jgi:RNA polymerase-binding transcription factor DksA
VGASDQSAQWVAVRTSLHRELASARVQVSDLTGELEAVIDASISVPPDDEHDAEGSTVGFERARITALLEHAERHMSELSGALERLDDGELGRCATCGGEIGAERLEARPEARACVSCAGANRVLKGVGHGRGQ